MKRRVEIAIAALLLFGSLDAADNAVFRSGDELIITIEKLDALRQLHPKLDAVIRLAGGGGEKKLEIDIANPVIPGTLVIDVAGYGKCTGVDIVVTNAEGKTVYSKRIAPVPETIIKPAVPLLEGKFAAIEPGKAMEADRAPRIPQPDPKKLRVEKLTTPKRTVTEKEITYPVYSERDLPVLGSQNCVMLSRQSFAPDDESKVSLYFSYRKAVYDPATMQIRHWRKMLVEVPLASEWLKGADDSVLNLPLDNFAVHTSDEKSPNGFNMLGEHSSGLAQGGQSAETDDEGRIYFTHIERGAEIVRFDPHTGKFEQPPVDLDVECRKMIPVLPGWTRGFDTLGELVHARGRIYIVFARNYRVMPPNGNVEACSGVISVPVENWDDTAKFRSDIRLHAGSWDGAPNRLFDSEVPVNTYKRKFFSPIATGAGFYFTAAADHEGGPWRFDLDKDGNVTRVAVVTGVNATVDTSGKPIESTDFITYNGLRRQQVMNVGYAGRKFMDYGYGEFVMPRACLSLALPGATREQLVDSAGKYRTTYPGAPQGTLTVRFDIAAKIKSNPGTYGELAVAMSGLSQAPTYAITPIPGEPGQAVGVCEYGYYFSRIDFSRLSTDHKVYREYLPFLSGTEKTSLPARVGLGPYNTAWFRHDDALWLYVPGYIGLSRMKYSENGRVRDAFDAGMIQGKLSPEAIDETPRGSVKDYREIFPALDGRIINIGSGRPGRGGSSFSTGVEVFDPRTLGRSETSAFLSRCFDLRTPVSRVVFPANGAPPRQQVFAASTVLRTDYVTDMENPALVPVNKDPKVFAYEVESGGSLRDLFGFASPTYPDATENHIALSPCSQFIVAMQPGGIIYTYSIAMQRFVDGVQLRNPSGEAGQLLQFSRPSAYLWTAPTGQIFFHMALEGAGSDRVSFYEVTVSPAGCLAVLPHLAVVLGKDGSLDHFQRIVRCFLPDLKKGDGSYDFVLGGSDKTEQTTVRVFEDFCKREQ